jgi:NAD(P)H dehydrogenase (quinone)
MNHLIIYANYNDGSFNHALCNELILTYNKLGHTVNVRDLYAIEFNPVLTEKDLKAIQSNNIPPDILIEQEFVRNADIITFLYPIWWTGMPAILKGYIDRVFSYGFAYKAGEKGTMGLLGDKKAFIINTTGQPRSLYEKGMYQALNMTSDTGIFNFCNIEMIDHMYFSSINSVSDETRLCYLDEARTRAIELFSSIMA